MKKTLFVNACVRPESRTKKLAQHVLKRIGGQIEELNLELENIHPLNGKTLQQRDNLLRNREYDHEMLRYARQFAEADTVVMAAPYWDLSFPAMLKNYLEAVTVQGITFYYNEEGIPQGLCRAQKVIYVMTAGGPCEEFNFGFDYIRGLCRMLYGIDDVVCFKAELLDVIGMDVAGILQKSMDEMDGYFERQEENR